MSSWLVLIVLIFPNLLEVASLVLSNSVNHKVLVQVHNIYIYIISFTDLIKSNLIFFLSCRHCSSSITVALAPNSLSSPCTCWPRTHKPSSPAAAAATAEVYVCRPLGCAPRQDSARCGGDNHDDGHDTRCGPTARKKASCSMAVAAAAEGADIERAQGVTYTCYMRRSPPNVIHPQDSMIKSQLRFVASIKSMELIK